MEAPKTTNWDILNARINQIFAWWWSLDYLPMFLGTAFGLFSLHILLYGKRMDAFAFGLVIGCLSVAVKWGMSPYGGP